MYLIAGWSSPVARQAHNLKVVGSNPAPATKEKQGFEKILKAFYFVGAALVPHFEAPNLIKTQLT